MVHWSLVSASRALARRTNIDSRFATGADQFARQLQHDGITVAPLVERRQQAALGRAVAIELQRIGTEVRDIVGQL